MRTIAQKYIDEGKEAGLQESKVAIAKKMLSKQKSIEEIVELTDLTREDVKRLIF